MGKTGWIGVAWMGGKPGKTGQLFEKK